MKFDNELAQELFGEADDGLLRRFMAFHRENTHVFREFERLCEIAIAHADKGSPWAIAQYMRWNTIFCTTSDYEEYKIPNEFIGLYGRMLVFRRPEFYDFFERRQMKKRQS